MPQSCLSRRRPALAGGAVLALILLAGCQSGTESGTEPGTGAPPPADSATSANTAGTGIAAGALAPSEAAQADLIRVGDRVYFATDGHEIAPDSEAILQAQAALLRTYPALTVTIEGHADERGTREYNLALAERRAAAVRNYLAALGLAEARMETISYGKERPECAAAAEGCWSRNRRGVTVLNR
jgi:peptidoglycan-associated lipoprotein